MKTEFLSSLANRLSNLPNPTVCIMGATFRTNNMGVSALASGAIAAVLERFPEAKIFFLEYDREGYVEHVTVRGKSVAVELVNMRFSKKFYLPNNIAVLMFLTLVSKLLPSGWKKVIQSHNVCLKRLSNADLVLSLTGGDSFSDIYGMRRFVYATLAQILTILAGRPLILLPQTIGPFRSRIANYTARYILRSADLVYARDQESKVLAEQFSGHDAKIHCRFCYDLGFLLEPVAPQTGMLQGLPEKKGERLRVGINVSGLLYAGGYTRENMFGLRDSYDGLIDKVVTQFLAADVEVILVPHVFGANMESDSAVCRKIYEGLKTTYEGRLGYVAGIPTHNEIKYYIGTCDFFVGSRMHACIAAISQCVPTAAIAYSRKFEGVFQSIGLQTIVLDACKLDSQQVLECITTIFASRETMAQHLRETIPGVVRRTRDLFNEIVPHSETKPVQRHDLALVSQIPS